ncbi:interleukin-23 receptor isoform X2 [Haplochromis burtoni]|uniref:Interleukin-12 receptor subunit beta-2-like n=1 Tax=Haplochromis burtoni TaxID=8153 RepID=A0A3Q2WLQ8_HAPBU|nr:interleukin-23 receptor isoform X2 [Haplochromis burtoni]XP_042070409.1 interleukin-23 receptor isoform X2 [Haplochromis burtoni]
MTVSSVISRCIIVLLTFSINYFPLLPVGCQRAITTQYTGYLVVEPAPLFLMGSNLTVYCHTHECDWRAKIYMVLNGKPVDKWERINCTTVKFYLPSIWIPLSAAICSNYMHSVVNGVDLRAGLPPDKPDTITCETAKSSSLINCSWTRGQETYLPTLYNISVNRENESQKRLFQIQDADKITIPRSMFDENTTYLIIITASNHFGTSQSDPVVLRVKDIVIPDAPIIMQIQFPSNSVAATLQWKSNESSVYLRPHVMLRTNNTSWEMRAGVELGKNLIRVDNLTHLTEYEFQMKICNTAPVPTHTNASSISARKALLCSKWSPSVRKKSPGKGPSQQLQVWRKVERQGTDGQRNVTVLWKPLPQEDFSGKVIEYDIFLDNGQKLKTCAAECIQCSVQLPAEVSSLSISAVTTYGKSPPADVILRQSGVPGSLLIKFSPAADGSAVFLSWSWTTGNYPSTQEEELRYYVIERTNVSGEGLWWQTLAKDLKSTSITGLAPGVRYNISLYAVTTRGVSAPSSILLYSKEQKPLSGPSLSVLAHEAQRIQIQWEELPVYQQRGFITKYNIYCKTPESKDKELNKTVSAPGPRQEWLNCPEGTVVLQMTASNSAGEGPRGRRIYSEAAAPPVGLVVVCVFIVAIFIAIIANLMCWRCVRERIKQKCISWGPAWLVENLPKPGHSNAIRLLEHDGVEPLFSCTHNDPPLSPITVISQEERDEIYPNIHVEESQIGSGPLTVKTPFLMSDTEKMLVDRRLEHVCYKPQIGMMTSEEEEVNEVEEKQMDAPLNGEDGSCSSVFEGLLSGLLLSVDVNSSYSSRERTHGFLNDRLRPKPPEPSTISRGFQFLQQHRGTVDEVETDSPSLDLPQDEIMTPDTADPSLSQCTGEIILFGGYFPQIAAVSSDQL